MGTPHPYVPNPMPGKKPGGKREADLAKAEKRPLRVHNEKYLRLTYESVSDNDWREIVDKAVEQAKQGNASARQWLSNYTIGIPRQMPNDEEEQDQSVTIICNFPRPQPKSEEKVPEIIEGEVKNAEDSIQPG